MKKLLLAIPLLLATTAPAYATAGQSCSTTGANPIEVELVISRAAGGPLISASLIENGKEIPTERAQWWLDGKELRVLLIDPNAEVEEAEIRARRRGDDYVGTLKRGDRSLRVRCVESG